MAFKTATRDGTKAIIGIHSGSGGGKTLSALMIARGLVGADGDIFMGDTESRRGEFYVNQYGIGEYLVEQITAPYSSQRYQKLFFDVAEQVKPDRPAVLIVDSFSHEWEGVGGVISAAEDVAKARASRYNSGWNGEVSFGDWKGPKAAHKHMMLTLMGSPFHIICCLRSQYKSRQIMRKDFEKYGIDPSSTKAKSVVSRDEYQTPIQEGNEDQGFINEMTICLELDKNNAGVPVHNSGFKCPDLLLPAFPKGEQISIKTGERLRSLIAASDDADTTEPKAKATGAGVSGAKLQDQATAKAEEGTNPYREWYLALSSDEKTELTQSTMPDRFDFDNLRPIHEVCKKIAAEKDSSK